jgi:hypothetical protein
MQISTPVRLGRTDLGYAEVGLRGWQCTYRLPGDLPGFADAVEALRASSSFGEPVSLLVDPVRFAVLDVAIPGPRPTREISPR